MNCDKVLTDKVLNRKDARIELTFVLFYGAEYFYGLATFSQVHCFAFIKSKNLCLFNPCVVSIPHTIIKFYSSADRWKQERKLLNSTFSIPILQSYVPAFNSCIQDSVKQLRQKCDKGEFDIKHDVSLAVMSAVLSKSKQKLHWLSWSNYFF